MTIDLKEDSFLPGKKNYERVRSSLANNLREKFNVILAWDPPGKLKGEINENLKEESFSMNNSHSQMTHYVPRL